MLQPSFLCLLVRNCTQGLPLIAAHSAHAQPRLLEHLHLRQGAARLAQRAELFEVDGHSKLLAKLDVDETPAWIFPRGLGVVVRGAGLAGGFCSWGRICE